MLGTRCDVKLLWRTYSYFESNNSHRDLNFRQQRIVSVPIHSSKVVLLVPRHITETVFTTAQILESEAENVGLSSPIIERHSMRLFITCFVSRISHIILPLHS